MFKYSQGRVGLWALIAVTPTLASLIGLIAGIMLAATKSGRIETGIVAAAFISVLVEIALLPATLRKADLSMRSAAAMAAAAIGPLVLLGGGVLIFPEARAVVLGIVIVVFCLTCIVSYYFLGWLPPIRSEVEEAIAKSERELTEARQIIEKC